MEFVKVDGDDSLKIMYTPYVYAIVNDYTYHFTVRKGDQIKAIRKDFKKY